MEIKDLAGMKVLVTGATGFVGSHLTRRLLSLGACVSILARKSSDQRLLDEFLAAGAEIFYGDVTDRTVVSEAVSGREYVFHVAALFREAKHPDSVYHNVNVEGVRNVLDAAEKHGIIRMVHCSTVGVHSHIPKPPANEDEPYRPGDIYQSTKCEGEKLAKSYFQDGRVEGVIIRPAMVWGEGDRRMLKLFRGVARRKFPIIGSGKTLTHWVYIHDLVEGFLLAAVRQEAKGQTYILGGKRPVSILELVDAVAKKAGVKPLPIKVPALPIQLLGTIVETICIPLGIEPPIYRRRVDFFTKDRSFDISKACRELGYEPKNEFTYEVECIFNWYKEQGLL